MATLLIASDAHLHLQDDLLWSHRDLLLRDCEQAGVNKLVVNGTCPEDWDRVASAAAISIRILPSYGLHPWKAASRGQDWFEDLSRRLEADPRACVGEIGLDRWIVDRIRPDDPRLPPGGAPSLASQEAVFLPQLELASRLNRPATLHCLDAWGRFLDLLRHSPLPARGFLLHAYSGPADLVGPFSDLGAYFSFNGAFLEPRKTRLQDVFRAVPEERLLLETDAPAMLPPEGFRTPPAPGAGERGLATHPAWVSGYLRPLAGIRGVAPERLACAIEDNFKRLFPL